MNTITIYIDENLNAQAIEQLKNEMMALPHVVDVESPRMDEHDLTVEYEPNCSIPRKVLQWLRSKGLHPDIISA